MDAPGGKDAQGVDAARGDATTAVARRDRPDQQANKRAKVKKMADGQGDSGRSGSGGSVARRSAFEVYKRGQGYWVRLCTAVGSGILILAGADFVYRQLDVFRTSEVWTLWMQIGIPVAVSVGLGYLLFYLVGVNRRCCDFMIATEGEMKKVNWSTRQELWGSTKVVIVFTLFLAFLLFSVDMIFMSFFSAIDVLQGPSPLLSLLGGQ